MFAKADPGPASRIESEMPTQLEKKKLAEKNIGESFPRVR